MKKHLYEKLDKLNGETEDLYQRLAGLSEEELHNVSYGWSIIEVLAHLQLAEERSIMYMQKKIQAGDQMKDASMMSTMRIGFARYFMQSNLKWKAPAVVANPDGNLSLGEVKDKWLATRKLLKMFIDEYPEPYLGKEVYKHPLAGRQPLAGALDAFIYHIRHHVHQIKRIRKKINA